jgi:uncharacterized protein
MAEDTPVSVVADTVIYLQASINQTNVASSFLRRVDAGEIQLYISRQMIEEIRDVLTRPEIRVKNARLSDQALEAFIESIEQQAILIDPLPSHFSYARDPDDEHVLNLAIEAKAAFIISHDKDLLALMEENRPEGQTFRHQFPGIKVLGAGEFLSHLNRSRQRNETSENPETSPQPDRKPDRGIQR